MSNQTEGNPLAEHICMVLHGKVEAMADQADAQLGLTSDATRHAVADMYREAAKLSFEGYLQCDMGPSQQEAHLVVAMGLANKARCVEGGMDTNTVSVPDQEVGVVDMLCSLCTTVSSLVNVVMSQGDLIREQGKASTLCIKESTDALLRGRRL